MKIVFSAKSLAYCSEQWKEVLAFNSIFSFMCIEVKFSSSFARVFCFLWILSAIGTIAFLNLNKFVSLLCFSIRRVGESDLYLEYWLFSSCFLITSYNWSSRLLYFLKFIYEGSSLILLNCLFSLLLSRKLFCWLRRLL